MHVYSYISVCVCVCVCVCLEIVINRGKERERKKERERERREVNWSLFSPSWSIFVHIKLHYHIVCHIKPLNFEKCETENRILTNQILTRRSNDTERYANTTQTRTWIQTQTNRQTHNMLYACSICTCTRSLAKYYFLDELLSYTCKWVLIIIITD